MRSQVCMHVPTRARRTCTCWPPAQGSYRSRFVVVVTSGQALPRSVMNVAWHLLGGEVSALAWGVSEGRLEFSLLAPPGVPSGPGVLEWCHGTKGGYSGPQGT